jgi:uncharacterized membrane protein
MAPLILIGAAVGTAAMYLYDPDLGRRRRALLRDKALSARAETREIVDAGMRDLKNRATAVGSRATSRFKRRKTTDEILVERVRSKMGRYVAHPGAIEVTASGGEVTLTGSILSHEKNDVIDAVQAVHGVRNVMDRLTVYETAEGISELQGGRELPGERAELMQENWSPGVRLLAGAAGCTLALYALTRGSFGRLLFGAAAAVLLARTATNRPLAAIAGAEGYNTIEVEKTIRINAPLDRVFEYLANYDNFPQFMKNVRSVQMRDDGRSHWVVAGPVGTSVEWDSETIDLDFNQLIAWRSLPGSEVEHAGSIHVNEEGDGTRVHIQMCYTPPAGAVGHIVAKLSGSDPKSQLDEDMMRLKSTLETGQPPRDAAAARQGTPREVNV